MKVLVTGGSGFLGRQIVEVAEERGHTVYAPRSSEFNLETMQGIAEFFDALPGVDPKIDVVSHSAA